MLVLSRKLNEKIHLGDNITLTVLRVNGNVIRLGIEAPRDVRILRGELERLEDDPLSSKTGQNKTASEQAPPQTQRWQETATRPAVAAPAKPQRRSVNQAAGARPLAAFVPGTPQSPLRLQSAR